MFGGPTTVAFNTWLGLVPGGQKWDYKTPLTDPAARQAAANFGNFNYGATCAQFFGSGTCQLGAGAAGGFNGPASTKFDIPADNYYVKMGYLYAICKKT